MTIAAIFKEWGNQNQMVESLVKLGRKMEWEFRALNGRRYKVEVLHHRRNNEYEDIWPGFEFVHRVSGPIFIEPVYGWVITDDGVLLEDSLFPQPAYKAGWRIGLPSPAVFLSARKDPARYVQYNEVASLRHAWDYNYYHFHLDVLGKLNLLRQVGMPVSTPLALGRYMHLLTWPRQILDIGLLAANDYAVPDRDDITFIRAEAVYYCRTLQRYRTRMDPVLDLMGVPVPSRDASSVNIGRRVFLTRRPPSNRALTNPEDVEQLMAKYSFEVVDTSELNVKQQVALFNGTQFLVALHGAGLTNIIYRRGAPMKVLELHAEGYVSRDMLNLSSEYGYAHGRLAGQAEPNKIAQHANFHVNLGELETRIQKMIGW